MRLALPALLLLPVGALHAQQPIPLRNGQPVTLRGRLVTQPAGRLQFATVQTAATYVPSLPGEGHGEHPGEPTRQIGLSGYNRYDLLYAHRGQAVTVRGTLATDGASPYYFHSTSLHATSIRLDDGTELIGRPRTRAPIAVDVGQYMATVVLSANLAAPWQYSARGLPDPDRQFLACGSNGGGDVVNCTCAPGFRAMSGEATRGSERVPGRIFPDSGTAQFNTGDEARRVELTVTCSR